MIEVKDWKLENYSIRPDWNWTLKKNGAKIKSPIKQVNKVRQNLISLHIQGLSDAVKSKPKIEQCIKCCVIFTKETTSSLRNFLYTPLEINNPEKYKNHIEYAFPIGYDSLKQQSINKLMNDTWIGKQSFYFSDDIYDLFKRHFKSPIHLEEEGIDIPYSNEQKALMISSPVKRKIKGAAGSGKTVVMAGRIVNASLRTSGRILVLTYNITLINYIKDRIRDVKRRFYNSSFEITNFHQWFIGEANNYNLEIQSLADWEDSTFFEVIKDEIRKYDAIFIDEVQDYHQPWLNMITNYFLKSDSEFVVFGDEKQNIYDNPLDDNKNISIPTVPGAWNKSLKHIYRFRGNLTKVAYEFQRLFGDKYEVDEKLPPVPELEFINRKIMYYEVEENATPDDIVNTINYLFQDNNVHPGDATIMSSFIRKLRLIELSFRQRMSEKTEKTFIGEEDYQEVLKKFNGDEKNNSFKQEIIKLDRREKLFFFAKSGLTKFSTIHSFKGWESDTIVLIIDKNRGGYSGSEEIIYTGLTRAKSNLFILNLGDSKYHSFFEDFKPD